MALSIRQGQGQVLSEQSAETVSFSLPYASKDVFSLPETSSLELELQYGNADLIRSLQALGIAGPFKVLSPWELEDEQGRHLINAGGYAALPFGEMYPPLVQFMHYFLEHSRSMSLPQQSVASWRAALEANIIALLSLYAPSHSDSQVFFSNSGAEAVEAALKFVKAARPKAKYIINFSKAYHGKTVGALSVTANPEFQDPFVPLMPNVVTVPFGDADALERTIKRLGAGSIVAVIVEPIQGEAGVVIPPEDFLPAVQSLAQRYDFLIIADEIQTGLGRSGHWFASIAGGLEPDIITLAKPLGGGMVPVGATIARKDIVQCAMGGFHAKRHSNTFGGGSLAMAVALKSLEIIHQESLVERADQLGKRGLKVLLDLKHDYPSFFKEVRAKGMLFAIQTQPVLPPKALPEQTKLLHVALALRTLHMHGLHACLTLNEDSIFRLTPALNIPEAHFNTMFERLEAAAAANPHAFSMLPRTPLKSLFGLAKLAFKG